MKSASPAGKIRGQIRADTALEEWYPEARDVNVVIIKLVPAMHQGHYCK